MKKRFGDQYQVIVIAVLCAMFLIMGAQMVLSAQHSSATTDEAIHILSGYLADKNGDYRLNPEHPFLGKMLAGLPHIFLKTPLPDLTEFDAVANNYYYDSWSETRDTANHWLYDSGVNPQQILFPSRLVLIFATATAGFLLSLWALKRFGILGGLLVGAFYSFDPTLLAHGQLANTDAWATIGFVSTILIFLEYCEKPTTWKLVGLATAFGIALNLKFSLILLFPALVILWVIARWRFKRPIAACWVGLLALLAGWLLVTLLVGFRDLGTVPAYQALTSTNLSLHLLLLAPFAHILVPAQYWKGLVMVVLGTVGGRPAYLLGNVGIGWWYYFPVAFAVKESVVLVLSTIGAIFFGLKTIRKWSLQTWVFVIPIAIYWLAAMSSRLTLGIRHLLPTFPIMMLVVVAGISAWFVTQSKQQQRLAVVGLIVCALFMGWSTARVHPYYLSYFNEFIGGPNNGDKYLADSNLDWGQDLERLSVWLKSNNISDRVLISYAWTGPTAPAFYGIQGDALTPQNQQQPRLIIISRSELVSNPDYAWLRSQTPTAAIGYSISIYDKRLR